MLCKFLKDDKSERTNCPAVIKTKLYTNFKSHIYTHYQDQFRSKPKNISIRLIFLVSVSFD